MTSVVHPGGVQRAQRGKSEGTARYGKAKVWIRSAIALLGSVMLGIHASAALPDLNASMQVGYASKASSLEEPMRIVISVKDPANADKLIDRDAVVTDMPKYDRPTPMQGETARNYGLRVIAAQEAHSLVKAERIAQAINTVLGNGRATVAQTNLLSAKYIQWNYLLPGDARATAIRNGQVSVTGAHGVVYGPSAGLLKINRDEIRAATIHNRKPENANNKLPVPKPLVNNHTGELGDTVQLRPGGPPPGPGGTSPGARGTMGTMSYELEREFPGEFSAFGLPMIATGMDADGSSSVIEFGIRNTYVASVMPVAGQSDEQVYLGLKSLLDSNGLPASYDSLSRTLTLDGSFGESDALVWSVTDTGFANYLTVSYGVSPIPEPAAALMLGAGLALIVCRCSVRARRVGYAMRASAA